MEIIIFNETIAFVFNETIAFMLIKSKPDAITIHFYDELILKEKGTEFLNEEITFRNFSRI